MPKIVDAEERIKELKPLAERFLIISDFKRSHPEEWNKIYGMSLQSRVFVHTKTKSNVTKQDCLKYASRLTKEELFTQHCCLAGKIALDGYMLEVLDIIDNSDKPAPF